MAINLIKNRRTIRGKVGRKLLEGEG